MKLTPYEQWQAEQPVLERLFEQLQILAEVYADHPKALSALQDVQNWAIEETVEPAEI